MTPAMILHKLGLAEHPDRAPQKRSKDWGKVRKAHLAEHPACEVCGETKKVVVHHIIPFHLRPELELDPENLITLCEGPGIECHITFGHLGNFQSWNPMIAEDVMEWREKIANRP